MDEKEKLIADVTAKATKKAKADKMNEAQTKLYVDEEVKKAVEEYEKTNTKTQIPTAKVNDTVKATNTEKQEDKEVVNQKSKEVKYIVHTPVKNFNGEVAGVQFAYGKAEVRPGWVLEWFKEKGYKVEEVSN